MDIYDEKRSVIEMIELYVYTKFLDCWLGNWMQSLTVHPRLCFHWIDIRLQLTFVWLWLLVDFSRLPSLRQFKQQTKLENSCRFLCFFFVFGEVLSVAVGQTSWNTCHPEQCHYRIHFLYLIHYRKPTNGITRILCKLLLKLSILLLRLIPSTP